MPPEFSAANPARTLMMLVSAGALTIDAAAQSAPFAITQPASIITATNCILNGMAVPNGLASFGWFEWGRLGGYEQTTSGLSLGAGAAVVRVSEVIGGLTNQGVYQFRLVVSNAVGVIYGPVQLFTTGRKLVGWGANGQLGRFTVAPANVVSVSAGASSGLAVTADNGLVMSWAWSGSSSPPTNAVALPTLSNAIATAVGENFSMALLSNGTVIASGNNGSGQTNVPAGLTNVIMITAGPRYGLALRANGTVAAWGQWTPSIPFSTVSVPIGLSNVVALAGGVGHCVALKADGTVEAWGDNYYGQLGVPQGLSNVVAVAAGWYFSVALKSDGTVVKWPGSGPSPPPYSPAKVIASNAVAIAAAYTGSLALLSNGNVLGADSLSNVPSGVSNAVAIASSYYGGFAVGPNIPPTAQGQNVTGAANTPLTISLRGTDPNGDSLQFRIVSLPLAGTLYQYVAGGVGPPIAAPNSVVADSSGRVVFVPTTDSYGEPYATFDYVATDGELDSLPVSVGISVIARPYAVTQPATMLGVSNAVLNGMVVPNGLAATAWFDWGVKGSFDQTTTPQSVGAGASVVRLSSPVSGLVPGVVYQCRLVASNGAAVAVGAPRLFGFHGSGKIVAWGDYLTEQTNLPPGLTNVVAIIAGGGNHSLALKADRTVLSWGQNDRGQTNVPVGLSNVIAIGAGDYHSLAVRADGTVVAWGSNDYGQTNVPAGLSNVIAVTGGGDQSLALKADGTVVAWGANSSGQATVPAGLSNVVAIAGGWTHSLALLANGKVIGWGGNFYGQATSPPNLSNVVAVASAGGNNNVALRADGTVASWGQPGQTNVPAGLSNVVAIGAGGENGYALRENGAVAAWGNNSYGQLNLPAGLTNVVSIVGGGDHVLAMADNFRPTAIAKSLAGYPNHDTVVQLQGADRNGDPIRFEITSLPTTGKLYQYVTGNRGPEIAFPSTLVADPNARVLFAPVSNAVGSPYATFTYVAKDGESDSTPATVTVNVIVPSAPQLNAAGVIWFPGAGFQLSFTGNSNATYRLWTSSNLVDWIPLGTAQATSNGWFQFLDGDATNLPQRFYRAGAP